MGAPLCGGGPLRRLQVCAGVAFHPRREVCHQRGTGHVWRVVPDQMEEGLPLPDHHAPQGDAAAQGSDKWEDGRGGEAPQSRRKDHGPGQGPRHPAAQGGPVRGDGHLEAAAAAERGSRRPPFPEQKRMELPSPRRHHRPRGDGEPFDCEGGGGDDHGGGHYAAGAPPHGGLPGTPRGRQAPRQQGGRQADVGPQQVGRLALPLRVPRGAGRRRAVHARAGGG
mmetsp:Transcript_41915/g.97773  ORF Transcript_41915/g.97773 Transcript_41915/m.97773 type:complete len:223 (-) Transcript_41915:528-1196(-)